ncbi:uncharacterized protein LOC110628034 isoform X2 [Manihot esculenta]|uniref:uncharacterized protein LOC110628034 isoform X2 n=1 Tax=Manihot esculenta TaxID=3983 RepID=UPI001CC40930|nr:uncharacterized protein LOC110628034 isoform X2 [Manihot esculenta]
MDEKIDKQGWKHQIACRTRFKDLYKAIDLPRMILQIVAATDGDAIIVSSHNRKVQFRDEHTFTCWILFLCFRDILHFDPQ